jgi:hypothetical protein
MYHPLINLSHTFTCLVTPSVSLLFVLASSVVERNYEDKNVRIFFGWQRVVLTYLVEISTNFLAEKQNNNHIQ